MTHGKVPFMSSNLVQIFQMIREDTIEYSDTITPQCRDLLEGLLNKDYTARIKLEDIKTHPWLALVCERERECVLDTYVCIYRYISRSRICMYLAAYPDLYNIIGVYKPCSESRS